MQLQRSIVPAAALLVLALAACDDEPAGPRLERAEVSGFYDVSLFTFDPQGSLPAIDLRARLGTQVPPRMIVTADGNLQFTLQDPATGLAVTADGRYSTTATGIIVTFVDTEPYRDVFLSQSMQFEYSEVEGTLTFSGPAPQGVRRARLLALAPELADEQLLDPTPGTLVLVLEKSS